MIQLTENAMKRIREVVQREQGIAGLRLGVQGGGCSGLTYKLSLESQERPGDKVYQQHGIRLLVDSKSVIFLVGTQLDYSDGLNGKGFTFANPNAKKTCGCGTSFSA